MIQQISHCFMHFARHHQDPPQNPRKRTKVIVFNSIGARPNRIRFCIFYWWYFSYGIMWSLMIIIMNPDLSLFSYLINIFKNVFIQYSSSITTVKSFYKCILCWFSWLYIMEFDIMYLAPLCISLHCDVILAINSGPLSMRIL